MVDIDGNNEATPAYAPALLMSVLRVEKEASRILRVRQEPSSNLTAIATATAVATVIATANAIVIDCDSDSDSDSTGVGSMNHCERGCLWGFASQNRSDNQ